MDTLNILMKSNKKWRVNVDELNSTSNPVDSAGQGEEGGEGGEVVDQLVI